MAEKMGKRAGEKSNFSVTCSLLSQYLKEKRSLCDLGLGITTRTPEPAVGIYRPPTTMSLLPGADVSGDNDTKDGTTQKSAPKSMELFPQHAGFESVAPAKEKVPDKSEGIKEQEKPQLTIFYGGRVLVFDNFPEEKAKDLMQMAGKESAAAAATTQNFSFVLPSSAPAGADRPPQHSPVFVSASGALMSVPGITLPKPAQASASDMPIARKNSLQRFLEKRKDRVNSRAPYRVGSSSAGSEAAKPKDNQPWLALGPQVRPKLELGSDSESKI